ncbi:ABC transporter substrate-binding protein [Actinophytocola sp.]|uniref:ABC transporter substrate-binding protein n=1 Tax=Actinophytocola sp. TaxID=1872138 RepID=UPI0025C111B7|nr:ABC transporter substrate-binding protein [Actinophytocola sp.]
MRSRRVALGITLLVSALVTVPFAAPAGAADRPAAKAEGAQDTKLLRVGVTQEIDSLNPFISITRTGTDILRTAFDYLTVYSQKDQSPEASLAESWTTSDDKLTWTFKIRQGVKWSDGEPVTAKDPAFTYNKMLDDDTARTANGSYVQQWESVEATDDSTLVIKTKVPQATMLALDIPIVPEHVWSKMTDIGAEPEFPMVGSGPFTVTEFKEAQFTKMKANPHYWRGKPKIDELHFIYYRNADAAVTALQSGQVDLINRLTPTQFDALQGDPNIELNNAQNRRFNEVVINPGAATNDGKPIGNGNPALKDVKLRQAIATAIDSKTLVDKVWGGYAEEAKGYIPPVFTDYAWTPPDDVQRDFDLDKANQMLDEAGYKKGPDGIRLDKGGKPLNLRLLAHAESNLDETGGPFIKGWLKDIGINITLQPVSDTQVNEDTTRGEFDLAFSGWNANPDPDFVLSLQTCANRPNADGKGGTPDSFLCDEEYDDLYAKQLQEFDRDKRVELVKQMQERLYDQATLVILGYDNALEAYRKDAFEGFPLQPADGGVIMNQQGYWGYYGATPKGEGPVPVYGENGENTATGADTTDAAADDGGNTGLVLGIVGGVVVVLLVGGLLFARGRRKTAEDRE